MMCGIVGTELTPIVDNMGCPETLDRPNIAV